MGECEICGQATAERICPDCEQAINQKVSNLFSNSIRFHFMKRRGGPGPRQPLTYLH